MTDTTSAEYILRIEPAEPKDDGMKFRAILIPMAGDPYPLAGYGESAVEAAVEVVAEYVSDP